MLDVKRVVSFFFCVQFSRIAASDIMTIANG